MRPYTGDTLHLDNWHVIRNRQLNIRRVDGSRENDAVDTTIQKGFYTLPLLLCIPFHVVQQDAVPMPVRFSLDAKRNTSKKRVWRNAVQHVP